MGGEAQKAPVIPRIKICCISSIDEARLAISSGGLVSCMPSGPGVIEEPLIAEIARQIPPDVETFLLTAQQSVKTIIEQHERCGKTTIQICDDLTNGTHADLRDALPDVSLVQVIHVGGEDTIDEAMRIAPHVDALLLDSGNQQIAIKELGGTGRVHDWTISRSICEAVDVPVYLAGGMTPANVGKAVLHVRPFGIDVCSGVRTSGKLDPVKLKAFFEAANDSDETNDLMG